MSNTRPPGRVALAGAGTMGAGIALSFAAVGSDVALHSRRSATLARAREQIEASLGRLVAVERLTVGEAEDVRGRLTLSRELAEVMAGADLVVESVPEDLALKRSVLKDIEQLVPPTAIVATNTSSLDIDELSTALERPSRFAAMHWFNPAEVVALVEVVPARSSDPAVVSQLADWARAAGKTAVTLRRTVAGYVANRLQYALIREAYALVESGVCDAADVDLAMRASLGPRWAAVGPFENMDLSGLDVHRAVCEQLFPLLSDARRVPPLLQALVAAGELGSKTGRGILGRYDEAGAKAASERRLRMALAAASLP